MSAKTVPSPPPIPPRREPAVSTSITLPLGLMEAITTMAQDSNQSRSAVIATLCAEALRR